MASENAVNPLAFCLQDAGLDTAAVTASICADLGLDGAALDAAAQARVDFYLSVYAWGCGKTTLTTELIALLERDGLSAVCVSLDDFYLTHAEQVALAERESGNALLKYRGNAGTHDMALAAETLSALEGLSKRERERRRCCRCCLGGCCLCCCTTPEASAAPARVPRYDKTAFEGRGDRAEESSWATVAAPLHVVLLEGWQLGFSPLAESDASLRERHRGLPAVNALLAGPGYATLDNACDCWVVVKVGDPRCVYAWRRQAEQAARAKGHSAMTDDEVDDFVERYMPAYKAYLPGLYASGPRGAAAKDVLVVEVDAARAVVAASETVPLPATRAPVEIEMQ